MGTVSFSRLQRLVSAYLDEEAALAQRQALATHSQPLSISITSLKPSETPKSKEIRKVIV